MEDDLGEKVAGDIVRTGAPLIIDGGYTAK
jgi:hypothetical protein